MGGFLIGCVALVVLFFLAYLAACAGAERWLTFMEWWGEWPKAPLADEGRDNPTS